MLQRMKSKMINLSLLTMLVAFMGADNASAEVVSIRIDLLAPPMSDAIDKAAIDQALINHKETVKQQVMKDQASRRPRQAGGPWKSLWWIL